MPVVAPRVTSISLEKILAARSPGVVAAVRAVLDDVRPCVRLSTSRASERPLKPGLLARLLGAPAPVPVLSVLASKFGGLPYCERASDLSGRKFLGQINFAEANRALNDAGFPLPDGLPRAGLLAVDLGASIVDGAVRWYPDPQQEKACTPSAWPAVGRYEAAIRFEGCWSVRGLSWFDPVPRDDDDLWNAMNDLEVAGVDEDARGGHKLFGHPNEVLNEAFDGDSRAAAREHALIWRIDFDRAAGFAFGTNWLYAVIRLDDLARGELGRAFVRVANA